MKQRNNNKINPYKMSWIERIPFNIKVFIIKYWFAGAVYYFAGWGIYVEQFDVIDEVIIIGLILGVVFDTMVSGILRFIETDKEKADRYLLFRKKKFYTIFLSVIYCTLVTLMIAYTYDSINRLIGDGITIGAEPFGFALLFFVYDYVILFFVNLVRDRSLKERSD